MKTAVEWLVEELGEYFPNEIGGIHLMIKQAKEMEKQRTIDFGDFIIDELAPMAQNRDWVEERYNYFKSE
jgi:hypothetical protein